MSPSFTIETEQEEDGRWIPEVVEIPGPLAYGSTSHEAIVKGPDPGSSCGTSRPDGTRRERGER